MRHQSQRRCRLLRDLGALGVRADKRDRFPLLAHDLVDIGDLGRGQGRLGSGLYGRADLKDPARTPTRP
jgi:hypothetical protein